MGSTIGRDCMPWKCILSKEDLKGIGSFISWKYWKDRFPTVVWTLHTVTEEEEKSVFLPWRGNPQLESWGNRGFNTRVLKRFNSLTKQLRNISNESVEDFKENLVKFLQKLLDEPNVEGLNPSACDMYSAAPSNSIVDQIRRPGA